MRKKSLYIMMVFSTALTVIVLLKYYPLAAPEKTIAQPARHNKDNIESQANNEKNLIGAVSEALKKYVGPPTPTPTPIQQDEDLKPNSEFTLIIDAIHDDGGLDYSGLETDLLKKGGMLFKNNLSGIYQLNLGEKVNITLLGIEVSGAITLTEKLNQDQSQISRVVVELNPPQVGTLTLSKITKNDQSFEAGDLFLNGFSHRIRANNKVGIFIKKSQLGAYKTT